MVRRLLTVLGIIFLGFILPFLLIGPNIPHNTNHEHDAIGLFFLKGVQALLLMAFSGVAIFVVWIVITGTINYVIEGEFRGINPFRPRKKIR